MYNLYQGTTPTIKLIIPYNANEIDTLIVSFQQKSTTVLELDLVSNTDSISLTDKLITINLTQEQTSLFVARYDIELQCKIKLSTGKVVASNIENLILNKTINQDIL